MTRFLKVCLSTLIIAFTLFPFKSEAVTHVSWIGELNQTHDIMQMLFRKNWLFFKLNVGIFGAILLDFPVHSDNLTCFD